MFMIIWIGTAFAITISYRKDRKRTLFALKRSLDSMANLLPGLLGMIAAVGLVIAVVPEKQLVQLFSLKGVCGLALVSIAGAIVTIPGPIAFPLAGALLRMGAAPSALASFITTLTMVGLVTAPLESSFFGARFVMMRQFFSFISAVVIGLIMGALL